jgi:hypothetical protein
MLLSHSKKFIFVHVYKNAGTSLRKSLLPYAYPLHRRVLNKVLGPFGVRAFDPMPCHGHASAQEIREVLGEKIFRDYYKFAVVRNPWDWQLSLYTFMRKDRLHFQHDISMSFRSFDEYLQWRVNCDLNLQVDYLTDLDGSILVDDLLRFERLSEDFSRLSKRLGITAKMFHENRSKDSGYQSSYSEFGRKLVERHFAEDIERFGYTFE